LGPQPLSASERSVVDRDALGAAGTTILCFLIGVDAGLRRDGLIGVYSSFKLMGLWRFDGWEGSFDDDVEADEFVSDCLVVGS